MILKIEAYKANQLIYTTHREGELEKTKRDNLIYLSWLQNVNYFAYQITFLRENEKKIALYIVQCFMLRKTGRDINGSYVKTCSNFSLSSSRKQNNFICQAVESFRRDWNANSSYFKTKGSTRCNVIHKTIVNNSSKTHVNVDVIITWVSRVKYLKAHCVNNQMRDGKRTNFCM